MAAVHTVQTMGRMDVPLPEQLLTTADPEEMVLQNPSFRGLSHDGPRVVPVCLTRTAAGEIDYYCFDAPEV